MTLFKKLLPLVVSFLFIKGVHAQYCTNTTRYSNAIYFDSTQLSVGSNIQFGTALDFQGNTYPLRMDIYYPNLAIDTSVKRPFVMLFHGGGFSSGDKQSGDIKDLCIHLARRGFVCATVNYRLGYDFTEYGQYKARYRAIQDGHAALRYVVNNANSIRIDTSWLFVGGQSAGSLLALGMVYADQEELDSVSLLYNATPTSVELGNLFTSGNSLKNTYTIKGIFNNWGGISESEMDAEEMIPTISFHGELDNTVLIDSDTSFLYYTLNGSRAIHQKLIAHQVCSELTIDTLGGHGIYRDASSEFRASRASCFFKSIFCNSCTSLFTKDSIPSNCSLTSGIGDDERTNNIKVYPNPFDNSFYVSGIEGSFNLTLYNQYGEAVVKNLESNELITLEIPSGIYFMVIKKGNNVFTTKLMRN